LAYPHYTLGELLNDTQVIAKEWMPEWEKRGGGIGEF